MDIWTFVAFFIWMLILICFSFIVDHLLARVMSQGAHRYFVGIGVIVHELSHYVACLLTRTQVTEVKFFEASGGHVTHEKRGPLTTVIISMAPLFGCSLFILLLVWVFGHAGVYFSTPGLDTANFLDSFKAILTSTWYIFKQNMWVHFGVVTVFFLIFLYFVGSIAACIAPSGVDLKHAALGLVILFAVGLAAIYFHPLSYVHDGWTTPILDWVVGHMMGPIGVGIIGAVIFIIPLGIVAMVKK